MLIEKQSHELLATIIRWNPCCTFLVDPTGRFVAVNKSFSEWSGYAAYEIEGQSLSRVHVTDENLKNSFTDQIAGLNDRDPTTQVRTQLRPNGGKPVWGTLHTNRYSDKDTVIYWCVWEPLRDDTQAAFALALERTQEHALVMTQLRAEIQTVMHRDPEEDWILGTVRMARKYPKIFMTLLGGLISMIGTLGLNGGLEFFQRLGIIGPPNSQNKPQTGLLVDPVQIPQYAGQGIQFTPVYSVTTPTGAHYRWGYEDGLRGRGRRSIEAGGFSGRSGDRSSGSYGDIQLPPPAVADRSDGSRSVPPAESEINRF